MAIDNYKDPLIIDWWTDISGNKITVQRTNEQHQVINGKITLTEIPSEFDRVQITGYTEIKYGTAPASSTQFVVNYTLGEITFYSTEEAKFITIASYYSRGAIYYPSSRIYNNVDASGNITQTLGELLAFAKISYQIPVETYADIANTYPSPMVGYAVQTEDTGKFYRWNGTSWVYFQILNSTQLGEVLTDIGDLANLDTTDKSDLVSAINENVDKISVLSGTSGLYEKTNKSDFDAHLANNEQQFEDVNADILALQTDKANQEDVDNSLALKVDKVAGKGLSTNDYNNTEKAEVAKIAGKADISYVNTEIASVASGSPKGVYATLAALSAAIPSGNTNIYLVTADGKWYYWNGSAWTAGGTYQSTGIGDGTILLSKLSPQALVATLTTSPIIPNYNTATKVFDFNSNASLPCMVVYGNLTYNIPTGTTVTNGQATSSVKLIFNVDTKAFSFIGYSTVLASNEILMATIRHYVGLDVIISSTFPCTIDGTFMSSKSSYRTNLGEMGFIQNFSTVAPIDFNFTSSNIIIQSGTRIHWKNKYYNTTSLTTLPISGSYDSIALYFDTVSNVFTVRGTALIPAALETEILIAAASVTSKRVHCNGNYTVNGNVVVNTINLSDISTMVNDLDNAVPAYASNDVALTQGKVSDLQNNDTISFAFITDAHGDGSGAGSYYEQIKNHFKSILRMSEYGVLDFVCVGGDTTSGEEVDKNTIKSKLSEFSKILRKCENPVFMLKGNHDDNSYYTASPLISNVLTENEWYNRTIHPFNNLEVHDTGNLYSAYYYKNFDNKKVRVICLDACNYPVIDSGGGVLTYNGQNFWGYGAEQVQWLATEALVGLSAGWKIIVLSHMPTRGSLNAYAVEPKNGVLIEGILKACQDGSTYTGSTADPDWGTSVNVDFSIQGSRNVLAFVHGHNHGDFISKPAGYWNFIGVPNSYNVVTSMVNAPVGTTAPTPRTAGTDTEDCWDVITINTTTNAINCTRYGAGSDRTAS